LCWLGGSLGELQVEHKQALSNWSRSFEDLKCLEQKHLLKQYISDENRQQILDFLKSDKYFNKSDDSQSCLLIPYELDGAMVSEYIPLGNFADFDTSNDVQITFFLVKKWFQYITEVIVARELSASIIWMNIGRNTLQCVCVYARKSCIVMSEKFPCLENELKTYEATFETLIKSLHGENQSSNSLRNPIVSKTKWNAVQGVPDNLQYKASIRGYDHITKEHVYLYQDSIKTQYGAIYYCTISAKFFRVFNHIINDDSEDGFTLVF